MSLFGIIGLIALIAGIYLIFTGALLVGIILVIVGLVVAGGGFGVGRGTYY